MVSIMDREVRVERNKADPHMKSIAGDSGADKTKSQYHGAMELIVMCSWALDQSGPICEPIACTDLGGDQSARQGQAAYTAAIEREGITADRLSSLETDNTDHARMTLEGVVAKLDPTELKAIVEGCYRHLAVLEEKAAMDAAFPDEEVISFLRCFYEVLHAQPIYYEQMWLAAGLPHSIFKQLMQMPEPTSGKWEVPVKCALKFLQVLVPVPGKEAFADTIIEEFTKYMVSKSRGTVDVLRPQDAETHPHRKKWQAMSALVSKPEYLAGLKFYIDLWSFFGRRHEFCLAHSQYGNFGPSFHRHEMAVRVAEDSVFYTKARANPSSVFPETEEFLKHIKCRL